MPDPCVTRAADLPESIALALSGGGFRATLFHLGVVRALAEAGLLSRVKLISSVSGGSVLAADLVLNWASYCPAGKFEAGSFDDACKPLMRFVQSNVRGRIFQCVPILTPLRMMVALANTVKLPTAFRHRLDRWMGGLTSTASLCRNLDRGLFHDRPLSDLGQKGAGGAPKPPTDKPLLWILATNLTKNGPCYFSFEGYCSTLQRPNEIDGAGTMSVSQAVASSAAFPLFFPALGLRKIDLNWSEEQFAGECQYVSDAGILDNLGIEGILALGQKTGGSHSLFVSDATGAVRWEIKSRMAFLHGTLIRTLDVMSGLGRLYGLSKLNSTVAHSLGWNSHVVVNIASKHEHWASIPKPVQEYVPFIRTDFDRFSPMEIACIVRHGYDTCWSVLQEKYGIQREGDKPLASCGGVDFEAPTADMDTVRRRIQRSTQLRWHLVDRRNPGFAITLFLLLSTLAGFFWWYSNSTANQIRSAEREAQRALQEKQAIAERSVSTAHATARVDRWRELAAIIKNRAPMSLAQSSLPVVPAPSAFYSGPSGLTVLKDRRVFDLRGWRKVPVPNRTEIDYANDSAVTVYIRMAIRKDQAVPELQIPFKTNGSSLQVNGPSRYPCKLIAQDAVVVDDQRPVVRTFVLSVDIRSVPIGGEFEISAAATYWNGLQEESDTSVGVPIWSPGEEVSLLVVWPESMRMPKCRRGIGDFAEPYQGSGQAADIGQLEHDEARGFTGWHVPAAKGKGTVVRLIWDWEK